MSENDKSAEFGKIEESMLDLLDKMDQKERLEAIDDLIHRLGFEKRLTELTEEERAHMNDETLSPEARKALEAEKNAVAREERLTMYARSHYFKQCAWIDYLNGTSTEKPFTSTQKK